MGKRTHHVLARRQQQSLDRAFIRAYREDARREQESKCKYCRDPLTAMKATADHVIPRHHHGNDHRKNIVASCQPCNVTRGHMPVEQFVKLVQKPTPGCPIRIHLAASRLRINLRLEQMARTLAIATGAAA